MIQFGRLDTGTLVAHVSQMLFQKRFNPFRAARSKAVLTISGLMVTSFAPFGAFGDVSIPLELVYKDGLAWGMTVPLSVAGVPKKFALDTGAAMTMLEADSQVQKFKLLGQLPFEGILTSKGICKAVIVPYIKAGPAKMKSFPAKFCNSGSRSYNNLGIDVFQGYTFKLDLEHSRLGILTESPKELSYFSLERADGYALRIDISFGIQPVHAIFDTGTSTTVVDSEFIKEHPETFVRVQASALATDVVGMSSPLDIYLASNLRVGDIRIEKMYVVAKDLTAFQKDFSAKVILGNDVIFRGNWIFDLRQNRWVVSPR